MTDSSELLSVCVVALNESVPLDLYLVRNNEISYSSSSEGPCTEKEAYVIKCHPCLFFSQILRDTSFGDEIPIQIWTLLYLTRTGGYSGYKPSIKIVVPRTRTHQCILHLPHNFLSWDCVERMTLSH